MLPINESFAGGSLQGGHTVHVRTFAGMSGRCLWCDTKHIGSPDPERRVSIADMMIKAEDTNTWAMMSPEDVLLAVQAFSAPHVVIAGGEPRVVRPGATDAARRLRLLGAVVDIGHPSHSGESLHMGHCQPEVRHAGLAIGSGWGFAARQ